MVDIADEVILSMFREQRTKDKGFALLMDQYKERIYWHIRRLVVSHEDAEDLLQETFVNVYRGLAGFTGDSKLYTWLYRIATNECLRLFRERKRFLTSGGDVDEKLIDTLHATTSDTEDQILVKLQEAILRLPEKQRLVFNLRYYDELSYEEISQIVGASVSALKTNYHYASGKVKEFMMNA